MAVILLIDEDVLQGRLILDQLSMHNHVSIWINKCWEGLVTCNRVRPDVVILAVQSQQTFEWIQLLRTMRGTSTTPVLLIADQCPSSYYLAKLDITACLVKPVDIEELLRQVSTLVLQSSFKRHRQVQRLRLCSSVRQGRAWYEEHLVDSRSRT